MSLINQFQGAFANLWRRIGCLAVLASLLPTAALAHGQQSDAADNWPQWRGPLATGEAPRGDPPLHWSEADGTNIRWKT